METKTLAHTDLTVSRMVLGTMTFGGQADETTSREILDLYLDRGGNFVDTANAYTDGKSETYLGQFLQGRRDRVVLASKVCNKVGDRPDDVGLSRAAIMRQIEASLTRLKTDYLDLYYLHKPDYDTPLEESLAAADELVQQGKVRYVASSNYASWQQCQMLWIAERRGFQPVRVTQPMYNLLSRGIEQEYLPMCREFGLSTVVYNPLAGGLLTGKHARGATPTTGTRFDSNEMYQQRYWRESLFDAVESLRPIADRERRSLISLSLAWLLHHSPADCVILGASRPDQLRENLDAVDDGPLSPAAVSACDEVWTRLRGATPQYNR